MSLVAPQPERYSQPDQAVEAAETRRPFFDLEQVGNDAVLAAGLIQVIDDLTAAYRSARFSREVTHGEARQRSRNPEKASQTARENAGALNTQARSNFAELGDYDSLIEAGEDPEEVLLVSEYRNFRRRFIEPGSRGRRAEYVGALQAVVDAAEAEPSQDTAA